ncbi:MAG: hypothetical protein A2177_16305 [Spirochaetes bacterium RBG_13_68_11]|nr:MAG: hypothetical protein A2177_16305 [Spirochaetes bacterium RBG_13_68_11]
MSTAKANESNGAGRFNFRHHYIDADPPGIYLGETAIADIDADGIPDFVVHQQYGNIYWYDFEAPDRWTRYLLGVQSPSDVGMIAMDVDGDGWIDIITGGAWYKNSRDPRGRLFEKIVFDPQLKAVHDIVAADIDGDGKVEFLMMSDKCPLRWYRIPSDPRQPWPCREIGPSVHCGLSVGDLDGDGHLDVVRSNVWFENVLGDGTQWIEHPIGPCGGAPDGNFKSWQILATYTAVRDINGDGKMDIVVADAEIPDARIAWMENVDGAGLVWKRHELPHGDKDPRGAYHSLYVGDLDGDGDLDIFSCEQEGLAGGRFPRWFIWENTDGKGRFVEHVIFDARLGGHCAAVADMNGDGRLDICSKVWMPEKDNANRGRMHVDYLENLGGRAR